jgi:hypothetical protein
MAKTEQESIKTSYNESRLNALYDKNKMLLHDIYLRLKADHMNIYKDGIGFTTLRDEKDSKHYYLMVNLRPPEIVFDENTSKGEQRFSKVMGTYFEKYVKMVKRSDIEASRTEGLSLGVYWPVRDYSQCKENGGFIEYIIVYISKYNLDQMYAGNKTFAEMVSDTEVIASLDLKPPVHMRPVYQ